MKYSITKSPVARHILATSAPRDLSDKTGDLEASREISGHRVKPVKLQRTGGAGARAR